MSEIKGVYSETGNLSEVIIHTPGMEIESITPDNAQRALYSDILNLTIAQKEHKLLQNVLESVALTLQVSDLLREILNESQTKSRLVREVCLNEGKVHLVDRLLALNAEELVSALIEGLPVNRNTLTDFLSENRFDLHPLNNMFFTRDMAIRIYDKMFIGKMATEVRSRESLLMRYIFEYHSRFNYGDKLINTIELPTKYRFEGGDIIIFNENVLIIGMGKRTSPEGIDFLIRNLKQEGRELHVIVQELPDSPESFIHLDMVFTMLDTDTCMVYEPIILKSNRYRTIHYKVGKGGDVNIRPVQDILKALDALGYSIKPIYCGGSGSMNIQEREQWHSGANFFSIAPGKIIGYSRNVYTADALSNDGFDIISAKDVSAGKERIDEHEKCLITIPGAELARGGGGARCMTMPVIRTL